VIITGWFNDIAHVAVVAGRLRAMRVQAGLSGKQLADEHGWAQSKVSRIESGKQLPSEADVHAWVRSCRADPGAAEELLAFRDEARVARATFRSRMAQGQEQVQTSYNDLVARAHTVRHFETVYVPGLLQVPDYARRVLREMITLHDLEVDDVDAAVAARMQRQQALYDSGKSFEFLLAEPVLRWLICPPAVMRAQLDRLQTVIGLEHVRFGILPMGVELATTPQNSFQIYVAEESVAVVETFTGETFMHGDEAAAYGRALDRMWEEAVTGDRARERILAAAQALPT
jgi:transcriptional regulator with XRE-family HTH domain